MFIHSIAFLALIPAGLVMVYYFLLAVAGLANSRQRVRTVSEEREAGHYFVILIPAHDEEESIAAAIASSQQLDYPRDRFRICVIADNCTDRTAEVTRARGATVLERVDVVRRGKGFALQWALEQIRQVPYDAVVVQDADCHLDRSALRVFSHRLSQGDHVLQACYVVSNPDDSPISYAAAVGNVIENDLFYAPKSRLGLSVLLRGTGMVLHRAVLERCPWNAHSIAEDTEYSIELARNRVPVRFLGGVAVHSDFPATAEQLRVQRLRWASGNLGFGKSRAWPLMLTGLRQRNWPLMDAGWTLLAVSRPLAILAIFMAVLVTGIAVAAQPDRADVIMFILSLVGLAGLVAYFLMGIFRLGLNGRRLRLLLATPWVVIRLVGISLLGVLGVGRHDWARTPRA